jgi:DNA polymerase elongation subunit (family B)
MASQECFNAWLLDVSTYSNGVILWVKRGKKVLEILQEFHPEFFAVPKKSAGNDLKRLRNIIKSHPDVKHVRICEKYVKLEDHKKTKIFGVSVSKPSVFKKVIREVDGIGFFTLYNTDLPIAQMYFYVNDLFPMSRCNFKVKIEKDKVRKGKTMRLVSIELKDNNEDLFYELPPLKAEARDKGIL